MGQVLIAQADQSPASLTRMRRWSSGSWRPDGAEVLPNRAAKGRRAPLDRFVFGYGMDVRGAFRNLPAIYAMKEE